jgi:hypothetical protein
MWTTKIRRQQYCIWKFPGINWWFDIRKLSLLATRLHKIMFMENKRNFLTNQNEVFLLN